MKRDYLISPSMIENQSGIIWFYNNINEISIFNETNPINVTSDRCNDSSICLWYISPIWQFSDSMKTIYSLLGEINKWTSVSRQRFVSITKNDANTETTIRIQGIHNEIISIGIFHSKFKSSIVKCFISNVDGQINLIVTPTNITCS